MSLSNFIFNTTSGIRFGSGMSKLCAEEVSKKLGQNILFITDKDLISLKLTNPTLSELKKFSTIVEIFQDVEADPSIKTLLNAIEIGKKINATGVIGFGGGSSMDVAKLTSLILGSNENIDEAWGVSNAKGPRLPLILTPTTPDWVKDLPIYTHPNDIRTLIRVVNELGQEVIPSNQFNGSVLFYIYNDGTVEKHIK